MQSRPTEALKDSSQANPAQSAPSNQYGFYPHDIQAPYLSSVEAGVDASSRSPRSETSDLPLHSGFAPPVKPPPEELNSNPAPRTRSPVDRIIDYEKATALPSKSKARELSFKVVSTSQEANAESLSILDFPNGKQQYTKAYRVLIRRRGFDTYILSSPTFIPVCNIVCLSSFSWTCNNTSCMETRILTLLSGVDGA